MVRETATTIRTDLCNIIDYVFPPRPIDDQKVTFADKRTSNLL